MGDDDNGTPYLRADATDEVTETRCPECRGRCYDKNDDPCEMCMGEGVIDLEEPPSR